MKITLKIIAALLVIALGYALYLGVFNSIDVVETTEGGYTVVGVEFTGPYSKTGKPMAEVAEKLKGMGITSSKGFGIYYDDPKTTPAEKCRSFVGNILEENDFGKIPELRSAGLKVDSIPQSESVVAEFPLKSRLSYMIGPMKAYPALSKYMARENYKVSLALEIYDIPAKRVRYIMQFNK